MRIRALAQMLYDSSVNAGEEMRRERIEAFLKTLARTRQWKLLPRIVASLEHLEAEVGMPYVELRVPDRSLVEPTTAVVVEDPAIIAGASVRSGDSFVDTSLRTQLIRLSQSLKT